MSTIPKNVVLILLVSLGVIITTSFVITISYNVKYFVLLLLVYILVYSIYISTVLMMRKKDHQDDLLYNVANYISLFNIFLSLSIFILSIIFIKIQASNFMKY